MDNQVNLVKKNSQIIIDASKKLIPWWQISEDGILKEHTEEDPKSYLDSFYLFPLMEISVNSDCDDIAEFINQRFQNILAAINQSKLTIALVLSSQNGLIKVFLGFNDDSDVKPDHNLFKSIVNGIFPGKNIELNETIKISSLSEGCVFGGIITGIPVLKTDNAQNKFNLSSVARSLYGKEYILTIISKPLSEVEKQRSFNDLIQIRDSMHEMAMQTIGEEKGSGIAQAKNENIVTGNAKATGIAKTSGHNIGVGGAIPGTVIGAGIGSVMIPIPLVGTLAGAFLGWVIGSTINYSHSRSKTVMENSTDFKSSGTGSAETKSNNHSNSISIEQQNGFALELEKIADQYIERMIKGFGSGYWETSITFATRDKISSDILAGTFAGELSKPNVSILPPPRIFINKLEGKTLFIPKVSSDNTLFPKALVSYITSDELSLISSPPVESIPGFEIQKMPTLALTDFGIKTEIKLGSITDHGNPIIDNYLYLTKSDLNKHLFVCGLTGSGKTTTVKHILKDLYEKSKTPFLVLESAKRDYRQLLGDETFKNNLNIFTIGDATVSPIRFNPFYIQEGVHPLEHIDYLKAIFNASFSLYGPMPSIVEKCLHTIYIKKGWDLTLGIHPNFCNQHGDYDGTRYQFEEHYYCFPTLTDLKDEVDRYIKMELNYKGELQDNIRTAIIVRLESLCVGAKGMMFNTYDFYSIEKLMSKNTILEMESLADDDDKAFFVGLILVLISEYRQKENPAVNPGLKNKGLRHFMVIEEAHRLLKNVTTERSNEMMGNPKGKAVEVFCNILAEMRSLGQGVAVVEQIPTKISPDVIKNSNTKIVHRLVSKDDQSLLAGSLSISDNDALYLNRLKTGHALCHKEGMGRPVECDVLNDVDSHAISNDKVKKLMTLLVPKPLHNYKAYQLDTWLGEKGKELIIKVFNSLIYLEPNHLNELFNKAKNELQKLLTIKNIQNQIDDTLFSDYFTLKSMMLLSKGIYCRNNPIPEHLKGALYNVTLEPNKESQEQMIKKLNEFWKPSSTQAFVTEIIENLTIQKIYKSGIEAKLNNIQKIVFSFFLIQNVEKMEAIAQNIHQKLDC